jgi:hypothetical protein
MDIKRVLFVGLFIIDINDLVFLGLLFSNTLQIFLRFVEFCQTLKQLFHV